MTRLGAHHLRGRQPWAVLHVPMRQAVSIRLIFLHLIVFLTWHRQLRAISSKFTIKRWQTRRWHKLRLKKQEGLTDTISAKVLAHLSHRGARTRQLSPTSWFPPLNPPSVTQTLLLTFSITDDTAVMDSWALLVTKATKKLILRNWMLARRQPNNQELCRFPSLIRDGPIRPRMTLHSHSRLRTSTSAHIPARLQA